MEIVNNTLAETFDVEPQQQPQPVVVLESNPVVTTTVGNEVENDATYARDSIYNVLEKGLEAINFTMDVLKETQHPRCAEVLGQLLKIQSDNTDKLLKIQKDRRELIDSGNERSGDVNIDKAIFVGSTHELLKMIKNEQEKQISDDSVVSDGK